MQKLLLAALLCLPAPFAQAANVKPPSLKLTDTWVFGGHRGEVAWATLSPDGTRVYTQSGAQLLTWDARSGQLLSSREPAAGETLRIVNDNFNMQAAPDAQRVLVMVGENDKAHLQVLELATGQLSADFGVFQGGLNPQWTPQQSAVVFTSFSAPQVRYWRQADGQVRSLTLPDNRDDIGERRAALSADAQTLYVLSPSEGLSAYDAGAGKLLWQKSAAEIAGRDGQPLKSWKSLYGLNVLSPNPKQPQLLLSASDGLLLLNTQGPPQPLWLDKGFGTATTIYATDWSNDGRRVFITVGDFIHEIDTATGKTVSTVDGTRLLAQTPQQLWTAGWDKVQVFDRATGLDKGILSDVPAWNSGLALGGAGEPIAALVKAAGGLSVQNYATHEQILLSDHFSRSAHFSPSGAAVASVGPSGVQVMDSASHKVLWRAAAQESYDFAYSPDGKLLAVGEKWQTRLLEAATGQEIAKWQAPVAASNLGARGLNRTLAFSPDGRWLLIGYEAGAASLWNVPEGKVSQTVQVGKGWVLSAAFSPDGQAVAIGSGGGEVRAIDIASGKTVLASTLTGAVRSLSFAPDGSLVAGSLGGDLRRWDRAGQLLFSQKLPAGLSALTFAGAGLVVGDASGQLSQIDSAGKVVSSFKLGGLIQSLDYNAGLNKLLVGSRDNTLHTYQLEAQP